MKTVYLTVLILILVVPVMAQDETPLFPAYEDGRTTYIDQQGNVVFSVDGYGIRFSEGLARVASKDGKVGYIDRTGKFVIEPQAVPSQTFSQGLALFTVPSPCRSADDRQYFGFIDRTGKVAIEPTLYHPCNYYGEQFDFTKEGFALAQFDGHWGFVDKTGKMVMQFDEAGPFSEGMAHVAVNGKFGFIDPNGQLVIQPRFDRAQAFSEGMAVVYLNGLAGFIDKTGKLVIPAGFKNALAFHEGLAPVETGNGWGYVDKSGRVVIPPDKERFGPGAFSSGRARVRFGFEEGFIDKSGELVIDEDYSMAEDFRDGLAFVQNGETGSRAYIDVTGKTVYKFAEPKREPPDPRNPLIRINSSDDVAWLEGIAGATHIPGDLLQYVNARFKATTLRETAYYRLGQLGTDAAVVAIKRVEARAALESVIAPSTDALGPSVHPASHFSEAELKPLAQVTDSKGTVYAIVLDSRMGALDLFLTKRTVSGGKPQWSRPLLIPNRIYRGLKEASLAVAGPNSLVFSFTQEPPPPRALMEGTHDPGPAAPTMGRQQLKLDVKALEKDSDGDGWTDFEEVRLGLNPASTDSDKDGIPDGRDVCPNYAALPSDQTNEETQIFQRAFFAVFGMTGSRHMLLGPNASPLQLWGYTGPVIYGEKSKTWFKEHSYGGVQISWRIRKRKPDLVIVEVVDYEGPLAASGQDVKLKKIGNEWFVIGRRETWIS